VRKQVCAPYKRLSLPPPPHRNSRTGDAKIAPAKANMSKPVRVPNEAYDLLKKLSQEEDRDMSVIIARALNLYSKQ
jgi:hypothetical protein